MGVKNRIKNMLGDEGIAKIKVVRGKLKHVKYRILGGSKYHLKSSEWKVSRVFESPDKHVFFGYYDVQQFNRELDKLLITKVPCHADTRKDVAELYWVDVKTGKEHKIAETVAWCWQQGARLRWHPVETNTVLFNDKAEDHYVTREWDIETNREVRCIPCALYDVTPDMRYGFTLNFSRLQRLRPGYGYNTLPDKTENEKAPTSEGLFRLDIETGKCILMVSIDRLSELMPESIGLWNYLNHISVSPSGKRVVFFHIWTPATTSRWMVALYCINADGSELKCLEHEYRTSHYDWIDDDHILTTAGGFKNKESRYIIYNVITGERTILDGKMLKYDGHPTVMADKRQFITDTYPQKNGKQKLYIADSENGNDLTILDIYSDPRLYEEKRCDLHPRVTPDGQHILIDSTFKGCKRSVMLIEKK